MVAPQRDALTAAGFPLLQPEDVAGAVAAALASEGTGEAWIVQPGREPLRFRFRASPARAPRAPKGCARPCSGARRSAPCAR